MKQLVKILIILCVPIAGAARANLNDVHFTENRGQWDDRVLFKADGAGGLTWWLERDGFTLLYSLPDYSQPDELDYSQQIKRIKQMKEDPLSALSAQSAVNFRSHALKFKFQREQPTSTGHWLPPQTNPAITSSIETSDRLPWNNNYFLGNDPSKWAPDCGNFQRVVLKEVWKGVDVVWRCGGNSQQIEPDNSQQIKRTKQMNETLLSASSAQSAVNLIEFDFLIHPGADISQIHIECLGLTGDIESTADGGELLLMTSLAVLRQALPEAFQVEEDGSLREVKAEFKVAGGHSFGLSIPGGYDSSKPLIVDPLIYSTYLGGGLDEIIYAITSDNAGGVVIAGETNSEDFPVTEGSYNESISGQADCFAARLNDEGSELIYSTFLGGSIWDSPNTICQDGQGGVFVAGSTSSGDFPTTDGAFDQEQNSDDDAFIVRLNENGNQLIYGTYLGGSVYNKIHSICLSRDGGVVAAGRTDSNDFPTTEGAFDRSFDGGIGRLELEAFVSHLNEDGSELIYSTYLGGRGNEIAYGICSDGAGGVIVTGYTISENFPTTNGAYDRSLNSFDAFVTHLNEDGSRLIYSTYLGGSSAEYGQSVIMDEDGGVVVAGYTMSNDFPTSRDAYDRSNNGGYDCFAARLNANGSQLIYGTYLGGRAHDWLYGICGFGRGEVVLTGATYSEDFPTTIGAFDRSFNGGDYDGFVAWLSRNGSRLAYSTFLGGNSNDLPQCICLNGSSGVVVAGAVYSRDFPTTEGAFDRSFNGRIIDAFITNIDINLPWRGFLYGHIIDLANDRPINEALVYTSQGDSAIANDDGYWFLDRVSPGIFDITASKFGFNDSTLTDIELAREETLEVDFSLRHPIISVQANQLNAVLSQGERQELDFVIANEGNGLLTWAGHIDIEGIGDLTLLTRQEFIQSEQILNDSRLLGVAFANDRYYVAGANGNNPNTIYILDRNGERVGSFNQPGQSLYGMKDLEWDGELLWGSGERRVFGFSLDGEVQVQFDGPFNSNANISWDSDREVLWINDITTDIASYDQQGNRREMNLRRGGFRIYGLAYWAGDPDHHPLYVLHCPDGQSQMLSKINPEDNDTMFVAGLDVPGTPAGAVITTDYNLYTVNLITLANTGDEEGGDRIDNWLIGLNTGWVDIEPSSGVVIPGEQVEIALTLNASGLCQDATYEGNLILSYSYFAQFYT